MQVFSKLVDLTKQNKPVIMALGTFDGIHIGHQSIVSQAVQLAKEQKGISVVFTFSNHPLSILSPDRVPLQIGDHLSKEARLAELGVDVLVNIPFTKEFARLQPEEFLQLLQKYFAPQALVVGPNYTFGYKGKGNPRMLVRLAPHYGFSAEIAEAITYEGRIVSSSKIRELLQEGELPQVNEFLGGAFTFSGRVIHGDRRGRLLGFPTANLAIGDHRAMLPNGVYAVEAEVRGESFHGLANIGTNPTFMGCNRRLEVHLLDFSGDLYDAVLQVRFLSKLREERKFSSPEALVHQMEKDKAAAQKIFALYARV